MYAKKPLDNNVSSTVGGGFGLGNKGSVSTKHLSESKKTLKSRVLPTGEHRFSAVSDRDASTVSGTPLTKINLTQNAKRSPDGIANRKNSNVSHPSLKMISVDETDHSSYMITTTTQFIEESQLRDANIPHTILYGANNEKFINFEVPANWWKNKKFDFLFRVIEKAGNKEVDPTGVKSAVIQKILRKAENVVERSKR